MKVECWKLAKVAFNMNLSQRFFVMYFDTMILKFIGGYSSEKKSITVG